VIQIQSTALRNLLILWVFIDFKRRLRLIMFQIMELSRIVRGGCLRVFGIVSRLVARVELLLVGWK